MDGLDLRDDAVAHHAGRSTELVTLNLRGTLFLIPLVAADSYPNSTLWKVLRDVLRPPPPRDAAGHAYFNRNPHLFHAVLDAMVNEHIALPPSTHEPERSSLQAELAFWGIPVKRSRTDNHRDADDGDRLVHPRHYGALEVKYAHDSPFCAPVNR